MGIGEAWLLGWVIAIVAGVYIERWVTPAPHSFTAATFNIVRPKP